jgi:hypothetical protein
MAAVVPCVSLVVFCGAIAALQRGASHHYNWELHRAAVAQVLREAPNVRPGSVVVLTNIPRAADPFGHNGWFDFAVRLAYPHVPVSGEYFVEDGTPAAGSGLELVHDKWIPAKGAWPSPLVVGATTQNTVVIQYDPTGNSKLLKQMPAFLCNGTCSSERYQPLDVLTGAASPRALRRYGPISQR